MDPLQQSRDEEPEVELPKLSPAEWRRVAEHALSELSSELVSWYRSINKPSDHLPALMAHLRRDDPMEILTNLWALRDGLERAYRTFSWPIEGYIQLIAREGGERAHELTMDMLRGGSRPDYYPSETKGLTPQVLNLYQKLVGSLEVDERLGQKEDALRTSLQHCLNLWSRGLKITEERLGNRFPEYAERVEELQKEVYAHVAKHALDQDNTINHFLNLVTRPTTAEAWRETHAAIKSWLAVTPPLPSKCLGALFAALRADKGIANQSVTAEILLRLPEEDRRNPLLPALLRESVRESRTAIAAWRADQATLDLDQAARGLAACRVLVRPRTFQPIPLEILAHEGAFRHLEKIGEIINLSVHQYTAAEKIALNWHPETSITFHLVPQEAVTSLLRYSLILDPSGQRLGTIVDSLLSAYNEITRERTLSHEEISRSWNPFFNAIRKELHDEVQGMQLELLVRASTPTAQKLLLDDIGSSIRIDAPLSEDPVVGSEISKQVLRVVRRALGVAHGFKALIHECQRYHPREQWFLREAAEALSQQVTGLNSPRTDQAPGRGFQLEGLILEHIFASDPDTKDPYAAIREALLWGGGELNDLPKTSITFTRGFIAITGPEDPRYRLDGHHYSYVIFNEHAFNPKKHGAFLVPTEMLTALLRPPTGGTLHDMPLTAEQIWELGSKVSPPVLNITHPVNLAGLQKAYPPEAAPHYLWEQGAPGTRDSMGHVHKFYYREPGDDEVRIASTLNSQLLERIQYELALHRNVYQFATRYQNLFDISRIALSYYRNGWNGAKPPDATDSEEVESVPLRFEDEDLESSGLHRMLELAYDVHDALKSRNAAAEQFPILAPVPALDWWSDPAPSFFLDTKSLIVHFRSPTGEREQFQLDRNDPRKGASAWRAFFAPHLATGVEFRLIDRGALGEVTLQEG